jgi:hypothetical protein
MALMQMVPHCSGETVNSSSPTSPWHWAPPQLMRIEKTLGDSAVRAPLDTI